MRGVQQRSALGFEVGGGKSGEGRQQLTVGTDVEWQANLQHFIIGYFAHDMGNRGKVTTQRSGGWKTPLTDGDFSGRD